MLRKVAEGGDMKTKFNVGDKVRIRKDLKSYKTYGSHTFVPSMGCMCGKIATIRDVGNEGDDFTIEECSFYWTPEMVESKAKADRLIFRDNTTILFKDGKKYVAKCEKGETFDKEKGLLVCLAKANGYTFKDLQEMLAGAEMQGKVPSDNVREVKRPAEVGEYVKVVNASGTIFDEYKNGDILKIVEADEKHFCDFEHCAFYKNERRKYLTPEEYVVLENYKPYKITLSEFWANKGKKNMAIHCKTKEQAKELLKAFDRVGEKWRDCDSYKEVLYWDKWKEKTLYSNINGCAELGGARHKYRDYKVYKFDEVDLNN